MSSFQGDAGPKVPAWKRLGLKLKPAASGEPSGAPAAGSQPNGPRKQDLGVNASSAAKRKRPDSSAAHAPEDPPLKKTRSSHDSTVVRTPLLRKQKSVTFTDDTKSPADANAVNGIKTPAKKNKTKPNRKAKPSTQKPTADVSPALEYLKTWKESRESWKFNKNHQSLLIKRAFDPHAFPSDKINDFYEYIRDLKGYPRHRLRETAKEIKDQDATQGQGGFPEGTMDLQAKQAEYDAIIAGFLQLGLGAGAKRKRFDETSFMQHPPEAILAHRVIKRMRAEVIVDELYDSDDESTASEDSTPATTTTTSTTPTLADVRSDDHARVQPLVADDGKRVRRRKMRVAADDTSSDESSSDSESESDSDDSSGTDGDDSSDEDDDDNQSNVDESSDSSDSESESDDDEDNAESDESDSDDSSDSDSDAEEPVKVATKNRRTGQ